MKRTALTVIGFTFLSLAPAFAQWSGSVKADGAWNFKQSNSENAEFKDIVDKDIYEETWNADMNYLKIVSTTPMHRAALLGINFVF